MTAQADTVRTALAEGWKSLAHDPALAQRQAEQLLTSAPGQDGAALLRAAALRRQNEIQAAHAQLGPVIARAPRFAIPWFEWGMVLAAMGQDDRAAAALQRAAGLEPGFTAAWRALGDLELTAGRGPAAGQAYAHAARAAAGPNLAGPATALCENRLASAEATLRAHLARVPGDLRALHLLGETIMRAGNVTGAQALFTQCLEAAPVFADARHSLAVLLYTQRKFAAAATHFQTLLSLAPYNASLRTLLSNCLAETGDYDAALPLIQAQIGVWHDQPAAWLRAAHALKTLGREAEAARAYRTCIGLAPAWAAGAYLSLADLKTMPFDTAEIVAMQNLLQRTGTSQDDAAKLHYALGRAHESLANYEAAFGHFAEGARCRRAAIVYDPRAVTGYVQAAATTFTAGFFAARKGAGNTSAAPIFIVGMPRAGSSLVEQILASHSHVEGAGELTEIGAIAAELLAGRPLTSLPAIVADLDAAALTRAGERYLDNTAQYRRTGRPCFTDKMPDNALYAGLIHLILPHARIVDVRRAPMAAGFAAFKQYFQPRQTGQDYSYDLAEIGQYTRDYTALMAQIGAALPGRIHWLRYERLVTDTEAEIRRLTAYCGLEFEPACLRFWETRRAVQTPSAQQVRQPIFTAGLDQWRHFEPWLHPLRDALGALAGEP